MKRGEGKVQIPKCEQRDSGHVKQEILPKSSITDQQHPSTVCATTNRDPHPHRHRDPQPRTTSPSSVVAKVDVLAISPPPARIGTLFQLPALLPSVLVPVVEPMFIRDHDPLLETNTLLRSRRGWAKTSGHSLSRVRTRLRTFFNLWKSAKKNP